MGRPIRLAVALIAMVLAASGCGNDSVEQPSELRGELLVQPQVIQRGEVVRIDVTNTGSVGLSFGACLAARRVGDGGGELLRLPAGGCPLSSFRLPPGATVPKWLVTGIPRSMPRGVYGLALFVGGVTDQREAVLRARLRVR